MDVVAVALRRHVFRSTETHRAWWDRQESEPSQIPSQPRQCRMVEDWQLDEAFPWLAPLCRQCQLVVNKTEQRHHLLVSPTVNDEECIDPVQSLVQTWKTEDGGLNVDHLAPICDLTCLAISFDLSRFEADGMLSLLSVFSHQTPSSSCKIGPGDVGPHSLRTSMVKCRPRR